MTAVMLITAACSSTPSDSNAIDPVDWDRVVSNARGQELNLFMWGGSSEINRFVDTVYGPRLEAGFGIELNRIPVADTAEAVNKVLSEIQAGREQGGAVDLIWINGENFLTLRQADALLGDWSDRIPNARFVDWAAPEVSVDFGLDVDGYESPLGSAQFQFVFDSDRVSSDELPRSYAELMEWVKANPGRFTYPAPPDFHGNRFIRQAFFELTGGHERWLDGFDAAGYAESSDALWAYLEELEPYLWRNGATYPASVVELTRLFANGEIDMTFTQLPSGIEADIAAGILPPTSRPFVFDTGTIGDSHYLAIPVNAAHPEAAMLMANVVLEPELQAAKLAPGNGWGDGLALSISLLEADDRQRIGAVLDGLGDLAVAPERLESVRLPEIAADYTLALESDWNRHVRP
jgi:putative spermidine/putrescine transport system substrate-binding protein